MSKSLLPTPPVSLCRPPAPPPAMKNPKRIQLAKVKYGLQSLSPSIAEQSVEEWIAAETQMLNKHTSDKVPFAIHSHVCLNFL